jgi:DNA polymerase alpha subunit B
MLEGVNPDGKCLHVKQFLQPQNSLMKIPKLLEAYGQYEQLADGVLSVMIAAGPFALDTNSKVKELDYSPLDLLFSSVASKRPEVLILCGPFIDSDNSSARSGSLQYLPDQIFHLEIALRLSELREKCPEIRILLVPSLRDLNSSSDNIFPQPPLQNLKFEVLLFLELFY